MRTEILGLAYIMSVLLTCIIIWILLFFPISNGVYRYVYNPCNVMNFSWGICAFIASFSWFNTFVPSYNTYLYIFIYLVVYDLGSIFSYYLICRKHIGEKIRFDAKDVCINTKLLILILVVSEIFLIPIYMKAFKFYVNGDMKGLRALYLGGQSGIFSFFSWYVYAYLIRPYYVVLALYASFVIASNHEDKVKIGIIALIGTMSHTFLSAGRMSLLLAFLFLGGALLLNKNISFGIWITKGKLIIQKDNYKRKIVGLILPVIIIAMVVVTTGRTYYGLNVLGTVYEYFAGPIKYLDLIIMDRYDFGLGRSSELLFGKATFGFISCPISTIIAVVTGGDYQGADYLINIYTEQFHNIGSRMRFNAGCTIIYPFLRDFGDLGIVVGPIILAILVSFVIYKQYTSQNHFLWSSILIFTFAGIVFTEWRYLMLASDNYMAIPILFVLESMAVRKSNRYER